MPMRNRIVLQRMVAFDLLICHTMNRCVARKQIKKLFSFVSRLGDGLFWYALIVFLPLIYGAIGISVSLRMTLVGILSLIVYKWIKVLTERPRPFMVSETIMLGTDPLDLYSFPSGHTLHAVAFSVTAIHYFPELAWLLLPFTTLIAASRVILGLHYPTDVLAGASIGAVLAMLIITCI